MYPGNLSLTNHVMTFENLFLRRILGVLILALLFATGCSGNVAVKGRVTYSDNGEPVQSGLVVFIGEKEMGRGAIKNGRYSVGLLKDGDGIPPGTYTVSADSYETPVYETVDMHGNRSAPPPRQQEIYYTKEPQPVEVTKSMTYDFTVERGKRP